MTELTARADASAELVAARDAKIADMEQELGEKTEAAAAVASALAILEVEKQGTQKCDYRKEMCDSIVDLDLATSSCSVRWCHFRGCTCILRVLGAVRRLRSNAMSSKALTLVVICDVALLQPRTIVRQPWKRKWPLCTPPTMPLLWRTLR